MNKNTKIAIGFLAAAGIGYLIYRNQKNKSSSGDLSASDLAQAEKDEALLAAKPEAEQRAIYNQDANDLADMITSGGFADLSFDGTPGNANQTTGSKQSDDSKQAAAAKIKNLVAQNALTTDDLKAIHDFVLAKKKKYPGKKSKGELNSSIHSIFHRYGINLPEDGKSGQDNKPKSFLGINIPKISLGNKDSIVDHQGAIK